MRASAWCGSRPAARRTGRAARAHWRRAQHEVNATIGEAELAQLHELLDRYVPLFRPAAGKRRRRPNDTQPGTPRVTWPLMLTAAAILMITMGARQSLGLFVSPLNTATGLGIVAISFAMAVGQFVWGASQPVFGAIADRYGSAPGDHRGRASAGGRHGAHAVRLQRVDAAADPRHPVGGRRRGGQLLDPDRRHRTASAAREARVRGGLHQRGRQLRPVRVRARSSRR